MAQRAFVLAITLTALVALSPGLRNDVVAQARTAAQLWNSVTLAPPPPRPAGVPRQPAPRRSLEGTWDAGGPAGIQALGAKNMPSDGKPEHDVMFTPAGLAAFNLNKPGFGVNEVAPGLINDWLNSCDPGGFPRSNLYELRASYFVQHPEKILMLHQFQRVWRVIWTDGRELPKDPEPRWYGYSVGRWVDDYTLDVTTIGMNETTWLDNAGRPHSDALRVVERYHRADRDTLELSVTIDDPKFYQKPWVALDKFPLHLQPASFDIMEMLCSASEVAAYNKAVGNPVSNIAR